MALGQQDQVSWSAATARGSRLLSGQLVPKAGLGSNLSLHGNSKLVLGTLVNAGP